MTRTILSKIVVLFFLSIHFHFLTAQQKNKAKKYPSVFWEISGNGLKKPSYLFSTMHVSSKMAFHLADSFYIALKSVDIVALETNPENWQDDFSNSKYSPLSVAQQGYQWISYFYQTEKFLHKESFQFEKVDSKIESALSAKPEILNSFLYRNYAGQEDFEENTFLDMYIFQTGKKLGKKLTGVENFEESEKLMYEAYKDALKDTKKKRIVAYDEDGFALTERLQNAYRKGDLDELDSLHKRISTSEAYNEKFLYRRNEIQAKSADSILKTGKRLFVGVGAAHVPGARGVIELLRKMGYTLRPIFMGERDGKQKDIIDTIRVPVKFTRQFAEDSMYSVEIPGKFYQFYTSAIHQKQYADMANGAYYLVTRVKHNASLWGLSVEQIHHQVDSLLYENIPGKMLKKTVINLNGNKGFEILNKTSKGDFQRYQIFVTPYEIIIFKISGIGNYVTAGPEANHFFKSIQLKNNITNEWSNFNLDYESFKIKMPKNPFIYLAKGAEPNRWQYEAFDLLDSSYYMVIKASLHNYSYLETDSFELNLVEESFASNKFIEKTISKQPILFNGIAALEATYQLTNKSQAIVRYLLHGANYYILLAQYKKAAQKNLDFLNSFLIKPIEYAMVQKYIDTTMQFSVESPFFPKKEIELKKLFKEMYEPTDEALNEEDDVLGYTFAPYPKLIVRNDSTDEEIVVNFAKAPKYAYEKNPSEYWEKVVCSLFTNNDFFYKIIKKDSFPNGRFTMEGIAMDTGSSRAFLIKVFYYKGMYHSLIAATDTAKQVSSFYKTFFASFTPIDSFPTYSPFDKKTTLFFLDYYSQDSVLKNKAIRSLPIMNFDESDLPLLKKAIANLSWNEKNYMQQKKTFIWHLGKLKNKAASVYLDSLYKIVGDTLAWQQPILISLLEQKTNYAITLFKNNLLQEPPLLDIEINHFSSRQNFSPLLPSYSSISSLDESENFFELLYDSLPLTKKLFPEILNLITIDEYKMPILKLLKTMVDSGYITTSAYENYFQKLYLEAKQELKKQTIFEKQKQIDKKIEETKKNQLNEKGYGQSRGDYGNEKLDLYATLLLPFWNQQPSVPVFFNQLLQLGDKKIKYNTSLLLLRNEKPVPDSMFTYFAADSLTFFDLYQDLFKLNQTSKIPSHLLTQSNQALSKIYQVLENEEVDTLCFIDTVPITYNHTKGVVYFYKYKNDKSDEDWQLVSGGFFENLQLKFEGVFDDGRIKKLDMEKPINEQMQQMIKECIYENRKSSSEYYRSSTRSYYGKGNFRF